MVVGTESGSECDRVCSNIGGEVNGPSSSLLSFSSTSTWVSTGFLLAASPNNEVHADRSEFHARSRTRMKNIRSKSESAEHFERSTGLAEESELVEEVEAKEATRDSVMKSAGDE